MIELQYDSFYKFLVSLGVILVALPFLAVLYFLNVDYILITQKDFENLSTLSLQNIQARAQTLHLLSALLPVISIVLILLGIVLIIFGSLKWFSIQKELDQQIKSDTITKVFNASQLNTAQSTEKTREEIKSEQETNSPISVDTVIKHMNVEDKCFSYFSNKLSRRYHFRQNLQIANVVYDMVGISKRNSSDIIFEIKYWIILPSPHVLYQLSSHIERLGQNYKQTTDHKFEYVIVIVTPIAQQERIKERVESFFSSHKPKVAEKINFEFFTEDELQI